MNIRTGEEFGEHLRTPPLSSAHKMRTVEPHGMPGMIGIRQPSSTTRAVKEPRPLVGFKGIKNSISIRRHPDGIDCRVSTGTYVFILGGTTLFGPVLESVLYLRPEKVATHTPAFILGAVWLMSLLSSAILVRYTLGCPRFRVNCATGEILYYAWWGSKPSLVVRREEVRSMEVEEYFFLDEGTRIPNYFVVVTTQEDRRYALCVSTDKQTIEALKSDLENVRVGRI